MNKNIDPTAKIHEGCDIHPSAEIGCYSIVYPGVTIKENVTIEDHTIIGKRPQVGDNQMELNMESEKTVIERGVYIGSHVIVYAGASIGKKTYLADKSFIREEASIADNVVIGTGVVVSHNTKISSHVKIMTHSHISQNMEIDKGSFIGIHVCAFSDNTPLDDKPRSDMQSAKIGKRVIVGSNSTILPDINIESDNIIGAGAVVTKSIEGENGVYLGVPAEKVREKKK